VTSVVPLVESLGELGDPAEVAEGYLDLPYVLLLDSASGSLGAGETHPLGRFSFLTADPALVVRSKGRRTEVGEAGSWRAAEGDALDLVRQLLAGWRIEPAAGLPPFQGGAAGYLGYDYGAVLERLPAPRYDDLAIHDVVLGLYDWVIAWDHRVGAAWLLSTGLPAEGDARAGRARARLDEMRTRLMGRRVNGQREGRGRPDRASTRPPGRHLPRPPRHRRREATVCARPHPPRHVDAVPGWEYIVAETSSRRICRSAARRP
jgi:anthranilate/para-aminobenzoate synthase component I